MKTNYLLFVTMLLVASCSSQVYSPSLNLTTNTLKEKQLDFHGGVEMMPETIPEEIGSKTTVGLNGHISYGFNDKFNLTAKGWTNINGISDEFRHGYSLTAQIIKNTSNKGKIIIMPSIGKALNAIIITGYGIQTAVVYQNKIANNVSWHGGSGVLWGLHGLDKEHNSKDQLRTPMGFGIMGYMGLGWQLSNSFRVNAEVNPIYQINTFERNAHFIISPTVGLGYTIKTK